MKVGVGVQLTTAGVLGAITGAIAGVVVFGAAGGMVGFGVGAFFGFGQGAAIGWSIGSSVGAFVVAAIGVLVALFRAEGDVEEAFPEAIGFGLLGAGVGFVVVGALAALVMGAQYALAEGIATSQTWALAWMPIGAVIGAAVGAFGGVKLELKFGFLSA